MKVTRQGVRDLNTRGTNGRGTRPCRHFYGPLQVVEQTLAFDPYYREYYQCDVHGRRCIHCGKTADIHTF